jgi:adenylate kinase family enzyme
MKHVVILGRGGAGKSALAQRLLAVALRLASPAEVLRNPRQVRGLLHS